MWVLTLNHTSQFISIFEVGGYEKKNKILFSFYLLILFLLFFGFRVLFICILKFCILIYKVGRLIIVQIDLLESLKHAKINV